MLQAVPPNQDEPVAMPAVHQRLLNQPWLPPQRWDRCLRSAQQGRNSVGQEEAPAIQLSLPQRKLLSRQRLAQQDCQHVG